MWHSILVPVDGTRFAEAALPVATRLARSAQGKVRLLMAHEPVVVASGTGGSAPQTGSEGDELAHEHAYLAEVASCCGPRGAPLFGEIVEGEAGPALAERLAADPPDLIVMATHGWGSVARVWNGSVADYLVRHVSVPILLLPPEWVDQPSVGWTCHKILVPLDLSDLSGAVLGPAKTLARLTQAHLTLVYVAEPTLWCPEPAAAQKRLDREADLLRSEGFDVATRVEPGNGVARTLLDTLDKGCYDIIALTTHGRGGLQRLALGSVADKVIRGSTRPVLVLRPEAAAS